MKSSSLSWTFFEQDYKARNKDDIVQDTWHLGFVFYNRYQNWSHLEISEESPRVFHTSQETSEIQWNSKRTSHRAFTCSDADPAEEQNLERNCYREVSYIQTSWEASSLRLGERDCSNPELHPSRVSFWTLNLKAFQNRCLNCTQGCVKAASSAGGSKWGSLFPYRTNFLKIVSDKPPQISHCLCKACLNEPGLFSK